MKKNKEMSLVSIIIPAHNSEKTIQKCLDSLLMQSYSRCEIIVVDDGSIDGTSDIVKKNEGENIQYYFQQNKGVSSARNFGIQCSRGKYIMFCDADDMYEPDMVKRMVEAAERSRSKIVKCNVIEERPDGINVSNFPAVFSNKAAEIKSSCFKDQYYNLFLRDGAKAKCLVMTLLLDRELLIKNDLFFNSRLSMMEDVEFYARIGELEERMYFLDEPLYYYAYNPESVTHSKNNYSKLISGIIDSNKEIIKITGDDAKINNKHFKIIFGYLARTNCASAKVSISVLKLLNKTDFNNEKYWNFVKWVILKNKRFSTSIMIRIHAIRGTIGRLMRRKKYYKK